MFIIICIFKLSTFDWNLFTKNNWKQYKQSVKNVLMYNIFENLISI